MAEKGQKTKSELFVCRLGHLHVKAKMLITRGVSNITTLDNYWKKNCPLLE